MIYGKYSFNGDLKREYFFVLYEILFEIVIKNLLTNIYQNKTKIFCS